MEVIELSNYHQKKNKDTFFVQITNSFMRNSLSLQEKAFYIYVSGFGQKCFKTQKNICKDLSITAPTLRKVINSLEEKKYIYVQRKYSENSKEKNPPVIFPMPIDENTGEPSKYVTTIINQLKMTYPSDY